MENTCSPHLYTKIRPTLALFYFSYSQFLLSAVAGDSTFTYTPAENIFLACGSPDKSVPQDGRNLTGDINSEYFSFAPSPKQQINIL
ncbi:hypothetical protein Pint_18994 [Pistacia integerrima]|uniref:Uncharacterized protein n=1 Tax=Pistacia integerrima TaxID=434235 RepID=A0ACC0YZX8_9ROSI|nr:hypothetical protein Pint_18994 [Pistacia integerrima]